MYRLHQLPKLYLLYQMPPKMASRYHKHFHDGQRSLQLVQMRLLIQYILRYLSIIGYVIKTLYNPNVSKPFENTGFTLLLVSFTHPLNEKSTPAKDSSPRADKLVLIISSLSKINNLSIISSILSQFSSNSVCSFAYEISVLQIPRISQSIQSSYNQIKV